MCGSTVVRESCEYSWNSAKMRGLKFRESERDKF